jgi:hypothetical protein
LLTAVNSPCIVLGMMNATNNTTMTSGDYLKAASKNSNVLSALGSFELWLGWYPSDYAGATEIAGDMIETLAEADELEGCLREWLKLSATEAVKTLSN